MNSMLPAHKTDENRCCSASIIIPVFNSVMYTRRCLEILLLNPTEDLDFEIIVVDNASTDETPGYLFEASHHHAHMRIIRNNENLGFAKACNQGALAARGEILVFLNNDTEPLQGWLRAGIARLRNNQNIGIVGAKLLYPDRTIQHCGIEFTRNIQPEYIIWPEHRHRHAAETDPQVNTPEEVQAVTGACLFIPAELFHAAGGFSEEYGMYFEDTDLCFTVRKMGKRIFYEPQCVLIHHEGKSSHSREEIDNLNRSAACIFYAKWEKEIRELEFSSLSELAQSGNIVRCGDPQGLLHPQSVKQSFRESDKALHPEVADLSDCTRPSPGDRRRHTVPLAPRTLKHLPLQVNCEWNDLLEGERRPGKLLLLALAPWPTLLSLVRSRPRLWVVWGTLPPLVARRFGSLGIEVRSDPLSVPFHRGEMPRWLRQAWRGIVVPALGSPLPSRWPVLRHLAHLSSPLYVASHGTVARAPYPIPSDDAYSWALDRLEYPPTALSGPSDDTFTCVRADLLGDVLLSLPALASLGAMRPLRLIVRNSWLDWARLLLPTNVQVRGVLLEPWMQPTFDSTMTAVDLSPPGWRSPLTPALARSVPARAHLRITKRRPHDGLSAMIATEFDTDTSWPECSVRPSDVGMIVPGGSSYERELPLSYWGDAAKRLSDVMRVTQWIVLDTGNGQAAALASTLPNARALLYPQPPQRILSLYKHTCVVLGVSTAITHLGALTGTPSLVVEHPTTVPWLYRAPAPFVRYIRPERPWWCDDPTDFDLDRAFDEPAESYGFLPEEWCRQLDEALARPPFSNS